MLAPEDTGEAELPPAIGPANTQGMVIVEIGPEKKQYHVHKALITHHSEYFRRALQKPWVEAEQGVVTLVDVDTPEFNPFVHWLYTQQLPDYDYSCGTTAWSHVVGRKEDSVGREHPLAGLTVIKAYALGDRILAKEFRRTANEFFARYTSSWWIDPHSIQPLVEWAFANVPGDRPILQWIVNRFCNSWAAFLDDPRDFQAIQTFPVQFVTRALRRFALRRAFEPDPDCYIEHATEAEKAKCGKDHLTYCQDMDYSYSKKETPDKK